MATIVITGAASGIGRAVSVALARRGHSVVATARTDADAQALALMGQEEQVNLTAARLDITDPNDRAQLAQWNPDIIINNAATGQSGPLTDVPLDVVRMTLETNVVSSLGVIQEVLPTMLARGSGRIIIVSSLAGRYAIPYLGPYCMSKFATEAMGDVLRREVKDKGIHVSLIEPGAIDTGFNERMNQSKYAWFNEQSLAWPDHDRIAQAEARLTRNQAPITHVVRALVHAVESSRPQARYVAPSYLTPLRALASLPSWIQDRFFRT